MLFDLLVLVLFGWLFINAMRLAFKIAWGAAKVIAVILFVLALPLLVLCMIFAAGVYLLLPLVMVAAAWGVLKAVS